MKRGDVLACSFESWYPRFKKYTIKSFIMDLPDEILDYIKNAPLVSPKNAHSIKAERDGFSDDSDDDSWSNEDGSDDELEAPSFPDFEAKVNEIIASLDGAVFPKLNWSAPKDAAWINFGSTLKCTSATDLLVLLKASDFISHDIYAPFAFCTDAKRNEEVDEPQHSLKLVLRAWRQIRPDGEFRCFIRTNQLYAICQRHYDSYFNFIEIEQVNIKRVIFDFFDRNIKGNFPLDDYVMDVSVGHKFESPGCVKLIDFNVHGPPTDGLMFNWSELRLFPIDKEVHFRWQSDKTMRSSVFSQYKLPIDLVDISSGGDPEKLIDLIQAHVEEQKNNKS
ncbi:Cell division cycle -like protein [Echinococcus granulosus]|nr:Cell division cycle -like protein [Echinococcus granulosus]CDS24240.1 cell division cycle protein 123 [Echinococcus granulosus]